MQILYLQYEIRRMKKSYADGALLAVPVEPVERMMRLKDDEPTTNF